MVALGRLTSLKVSFMSFSYKHAHKSSIDTTSNGGTVPTVLDNAFSLGLLNAKEIGISLEPTTTESITNGELTFGGTDSSKFTGAIHFV